MGGQCTAHDAGARDIAFVGRSVVPGFQEFDALGQMLVHANLFGRGKKSFRKLTYIYNFILFLLSHFIYVYIYMVIALDLKSLSKIVPLLSVV